MSWNHGFFYFMIFDLFMKLDVDDCFELIF